MTTPGDFIHSIWTSDQIAEGFRATWREALGYVYTGRVAEWFERFITEAQAAGFDDRPYARLCVIHDRLCLLAWPLNGRPGLRNLELLDALRNWTPATATPATVETSKPKVMDRDELVRLLTSRDSSPYGRWGEKIEALNDEQYRRFAADVLMYAKPGSGVRNFGGACNSAYQRCKTT